MPPRKSSVTAAASSLAHGWTPTPGARVWVELKDEPLVDPPLWTPAALLAGLPDLSHDTVDVLVLFVVRVLVLLFLGWLAVKVGTPDLSKLTVAPASDAAAPLLINAADAADGGNFNGGAQMTTAVATPCYRAPDRTQRDRVLLDAAK